MTDSEYIEQLEQRIAVLERMMKIKRPASSGFIAGDSGATGHGSNSWIYATDDDSEGGNALTEPALIGYNPSNGYQHLEAPDGRDAIPVFDDSENQIGWLQPSSGQDALILYDDSGPTIAMLPGESSKKYLVTEGNAISFQTLTLPTGLPDTAAKGDLVWYNGSSWVVLTPSKDGFYLFDYAGGTWAIEDFNIAIVDDTYKVLVRGDDYNDYGYIQGIVVDRPPSGSNYSILIGNPNGYIAGWETLGSTPEIIIHDGDGTLTLVPVPNSGEYIMRVNGGTVEFKEISSVGTDSLRALCKDGSGNYAWRDVTYGIES